jgi:hypothetical protein
MSYIKGDNAREQEMFDFLEDLRQSGDTNMFGAGTYLREAFGLSLSEATPILTKWMKAHHDPKKILKKPLSKRKTKVSFNTVADVETEPR